MSESPGSSTGDNYTNYARQSNVDAQIGVVHGDANFYKISSEATPEEKYKVGRNYLAGNMPRQAEKLIREAFVAGYESPEVVYYWALAVLSNRALDHLGEDEFDQLTEAFSAIERNDPGDEWVIALATITSLIQSLVQQEENPDADPRNFDAAFNLYERLPAARKDEVRRHLEMVLIGGIQDRLEAQDAAVVASKRMENNRRERVGMFFEQKPTPARMLPPPTGEQQGQNIAMLGGGAALALTCLYFGSQVLLGVSILLLILALLLYAVGAFLLVRHGFEYRKPWERYEWINSRYQGNYQNPPNSRRNTSAFSSLVERLIWLRFAAQAPDAEDEKRRWEKDTAGIKATLAREICEQYPDLDPPRVGAIDWLIRWHAKTIFDAWYRRILFAYYGQLYPPKRTSDMSRVGTCVLVASLAIFFVNSYLATSVWMALLVTTGLGIASGLMWAGGAALYASSTLESFQHDESERRLRAENKAFAEWNKTLGDTPTDAQMAAWLDLDKAHIKALAMRHYGLANRDLIAHVILTGAAEDSFGARVLYGPPRYSSYNVQLFLLTDFGVRQYSVQLHLGTGMITNERRRSFQYDAISSAEVAEVGVRIDGAEKKVVSQEEMTKEKNPNLEKLVFSQEFQLTLNNLQSVYVLVGNFDRGLIERMKEDPRRIAELTRDTSGVTGAVRILEAIAAEGSNWVKQERMRRRRRFIDYQRKRNARLALEEAKTSPTQRAVGREARAELPAAVGYRHLVLLCSGESDRASDTADLDRPLTKRGQRDAVAAGRVLRDLIADFDFVACSPAKRARETWQLVANELSNAPRPEFEERLHAASTSQIMEFIREIPNSALTVLVVGHSSNLQGLVAELTGATCPMKSSSIAVLSSSSEWVDSSFRSTRLDHLVIDVCLT
ncbi:MAG: SixA phosphatase family protein [Pseudonocardiaceae bacterium]